MKGFVYVTPEGEVIRKEHEFILKHDPNFFANNKAFVSAYWEFDSESEEQMRNLLQSFKRLRALPKSIFDFYKSLSYDTDLLKEPIYDLSKMQRQ